MKAEKTPIMNLFERYRDFFLKTICEYGELEESIISKYHDILDLSKLSWITRRWSYEFLYKFGNEINWAAISMYAIIPDPEEFAENFAFCISWENLSYNQNVGWTTEFIRKYQDDLNWKGLSCNRSIPWSADLIELFKEKWDWAVLVHNIRDDLLPFILTNYKEKVSSLASFSCLAEYKPLLLKFYLENYLAPEYPMICRNVYEEEVRNHISNEDITRLLDEIEDDKHFFDVLHYARSYGNLPKIIIKEDESLELDVKVTPKAECRAKVYISSEVESLDLSNLGMLAVPLWVYHLTYLKRLDLSHNKIRKPFYIPAHSRLKEINLWANPFFQFGKGFLGLLQLESLKISFSHLDDAGFKWEKKKIRSFVPENNLKVLHLEVKNLCRDLKPFLYHRWYEELKLTGKAIKNFPVFEGRTSIKKLSITGTSITQVPNEIKMFPDLEELILEDNQITRIDQAVTDLKKLKFVSLKGNPIEKPWIPSHLHKLM